VTTDVYKNTRPNTLELDSKRAVLVFELLKLSSRLFLSSPPVLKFQIPPSRTMGKDRTKKVS
jgi:hypothetical protein